MSAFLIIRYLHFAGILLVSATLFTELILVKPELSRKEIGRIASIDGVYGLSALLVLSAGLLMWFSFGKPSEFYSSNPIFIAKLILFGVVGSLSALPTVYFIKNRKGDPSELVKAPSWLKPIILVELITLFVIPLLAVLMAAGIRL